MDTQLGARHRRRPPTIHRGRAQRTISAVSLDEIGPGARQGRGAGGDPMPLLRLSRSACTPSAPCPGVDAVLLLGVDDSEKIWVNGTPGVRAAHGPRGSRSTRIACRFTSRPERTKSCSSSTRTPRAGSSVCGSSLPMASQCRSSKEANDASSLGSLQANTTGAGSVRLTFEH